MVDHQQLICSKCLIIVILQLLVVNIKIFFLQMLKQLNSYDHEISLRWALCARFNSPYLFLRKFIIALEFSGSGYVWIPYSIIMIAIHYTTIHQAMKFILLFTGLLFD